MGPTGLKDVVVVRTVVIQIVTSEVKWKRGRRKEKEKKDKWWSIGRKKVPEEKDLRNDVVICTFKVSPRFLINSRVSLFFTEVRSK